MGNRERLLKAHSIANPTTASVRSINTLPRIIPPKNKPPRPGKWRIVATRTAGEPRRLIAYPTSSLSAYLRIR